MNDVFTIVSIFVAVSGATYAAIAAFRDFFKDRASNVSAEASTAFAKAKAECKKASILKSMGRWHRAMRFSMFLWGFTQLVPILFFLVPTFWITAHLLIACWNSPTINGAGWWPRYKVWLAVVAIVDGLAILAVPFCYWGIRATAGELLVWVKEANDSLSQNYLPRVSTPASRMRVMLQGRTDPGERQAPPIVGDDPLHPA